MKKVMILTEPLDPVTTQVYKHMIKYKEEEVKSFYVFSLYWNNTPEIYLWFIYNMT